MAQPEDSRLRFVDCRPGEIPSGAVVADQWDGDTFYVAKTSAGLKEENCGCFSNFELYVPTTYMCTSSSITLAHSLPKSPCHLSLGMYLGGVYFPTGTNVTLPRLFGVTRSGATAAPGRSEDYQVLAVHGGREEKNGRESFSLDLRWVPRRGRHLSPPPGAVRCRLPRAATVAYVGRAMADGGRVVLGLALSHSGPMLFYAGGDGDEDKLRQTEDFDWLVAAEAADGYEIVDVDYHVGREGVLMEETTLNVDRFRVDNETDRLGIKQR